MKHKHSHLLVGYWSRIRRGRAVPDQTDIDPRAIKRVLPHVFILDCENSSRPIYRLAGTGLCERFGFELKGTGFLAHWEAQSSIALASLLKQALELRQPVSVSSSGASPDCGLVELETILAPITFGGGAPTRFVGMIQVLSDIGKLGGRPIAFQRLVGSQFVREDEPLSSFDAPSPPPSSNDRMRAHSKASYLRLVVSHDKPRTLHFESDTVLQRVIDAFSTNPVTGTK